MKYTIQKIAEIIGCKPLRPILDQEVEHLLLDSRQIIFPANTLFFALKGERHNAHIFLKNVYEAGVRNFVVSEDISIQQYPEANFLLVENTLRALQQVAGDHRRQFQIPIIGITGSNGKTIIKEWLFQLLREDYHIVRSPRSYNSQVGVPLSVWQIQQEHNLGIFEAGISRMGEMEHLSPILQCDIGLFTNIGEAHSAGFPSLEEKVREKIKLFAFSDVIFYCKDHLPIAKEVEKLGKKTFCWSKTNDADLKITACRPEGNRYSVIIATFQGDHIGIRIPFLDEASIENAIHCWAILLYLGINQQVIQQRMMQLEPVAMRMEWKEGINNCSIVNDSYNSDLTSLGIALQFLEQRGQQTNRTLILSDILQSGQDLDRLYKQVANLIKAKQVQRFIGIGKEVTKVKGNLPTNVKVNFFDTTEDFLQHVHDLDFHNEIILLKGARPFAFERIAERLALKAHKTVLEINLQNFLRNLYVYSRYLKPGVKSMVMVKAGAYGSGSAAIAKLLEFHGVHYLTVAYVDEGIELRKEGIRMPIMVLNPEPSGFDAMYRHRLEPEIFSLRILKEYIDFSHKISNKDAFVIHIKLNTGMNRLGFGRQDLAVLLPLLQANPQLQVASIFTHLAASEAPEHDAFTLGQLQSFEIMYEEIVSELGYSPLRHALNTAGVHRFPDWQMDMVRFGIGLYGLDNYVAFKEKLHPVLSLKTTISQIHLLASGESVGYGRKWVASQPSRIATLSIGYADGLRRAAGNGKFAVWLHEKRAPIVGTVAMDMCMVDVTHLPAAQEGDEVEIFGEHLSVWELANAYATIPLEVFTTISERVKRVYIQE